MSEPQPRNWMVQIRDFCSMCLAVIALCVAIWGGVKFGFGFITNIRDGLNNVSTITTQQLPAVLDGMQKLNDRVAKGEIDNAARFKKIEESVEKKQDRKVTR